MRHDIFRTRLKRGHQIALLQIIAAILIGGIVLLGIPAGLTNLVYSSSQDDGVSYSAEDYTFVEEEYFNFKWAMQREEVEIRILEEVTRSPDPVVTFKVRLPDDTHEFEWGTMNEYRSMSIPQAVGCAFLFFITVALIICVFGTIIAES